MGALDAAIMALMISHSVDLARLDAHERAKVIALLKQLEDNLKELLATKVLSEMGKQSTNALLKEVEALIQSTYTAAQAGAAETLTGLGEVQVQATTHALESVLNITIGPGSKPSAGYLEKLASDVLIEGAPSKAWWSRQAGDVAFRFSQALRTGLAAGETNQQIIARIAGTKDTPGVMDIARKNAAALVQTSVATVAQESKNAMYGKNADVIKGTMWSATLDGHTCEQCANLDGQKWDLEGAAMPGTTMPFAAPPRHWNCRCVALPVLKTFAEMGIDMPEIPLTGHRASTDGPVPRGTTFADWLKGRTEEQISEQFGRGRAELYKSGKISLRDMLDMSGNPLTLAQLKDKYGK